MTSSYRARIHATVRTPPAGEPLLRPSVPWALDELAASGTAIFTADLSEGDEARFSAGERERELEDAYQRGVLRQAGAVYQFRHARLQDHLTQAFRARRDQQHASSP